MIVVFVVVIVLVMFGDRVVTVLLEVEVSLEEDDWLDDDEDDRLEDCDD